MSLLLVFHDFLGQKSHTSCNNIDIWGKGGRKELFAKYFVQDCGDKAFKPVKKSVNYETLQIRIEKIAQNAVF